MEHSTYLENTGIQGKIAQPLISVIVPIYGIEQYVGMCIESLMTQTYKNLEIILVDDGSPDRCPEICDLYARKDSRIRVIHKPNGGLVSARKAGLEASNGAYIGYVDGDDWVGVGFYESLLTSIVTANADMVCAGQSRELFDQCVHFKNPLPCGVYEGAALDELKKNMASYGEFYRPGITTYVWNKLFKRDLLYRHQMSVDERISIGEDAAVTYPVLMDCQKVCVVDTVAYHYRQHASSMLKKVTPFSDEVKKLRPLHEYLVSCAEKLDADGACGLRRQLDEYVLGICIMRSGGRLPGLDSYSTFDSVYYEKKVVIFSAGTFGQQLKNRFDESNHCEVVGWIDDDYWEYRRCCMDVDPVESITKIDYDYVLIATIDCKVAESIVDRLLDCGVSEQKILTIRCPKAAREQLLEKYLYA